MSVSELMNCGRERGSVTAKGQHCRRDSNLSVAFHCKFDQFAEKYYILRKETFFSRMK